MRNLRLPILLLALVASIGVTLAALRRPEAPTVIVEAPDLVSVVVARADIAPGGQIRAADVRLARWPAEAAPSGAFSETGNVVGRVASARIYSGESVLEPRLAPEGTRAGLSAALADGERAVSVKVDEVVGVGGFVLPGARVDVLATVEDDRDHRTYTVLQNIEVLATDQRTDPGADGRPQKSSLATLLVNVEEAERLVHIAHRGRIHLSLRSPRDDGLERSGGVTTSAILADGKSVPPGVTRPAARPAAPPPSHTVETLNGSRRDTQRFPPR
jgi:pilus assembly protein CpaB